MLACSWAGNCRKHLQKQVCRSKKSKKDMTAVTLTKPILSSLEMPRFIIFCTIYLQAWSMTAAVFVIIPAATEDLDLFHHSPFWLTFGTFLRDLSVYFWQCSVVLQLSAFKPVTIEEVQKLLSGMPSKSSLLDVLPCHAGYSSHVPTSSRQW